MIKVVRSNDPRIPEDSFLVSIDGHDIDDVIEFTFYNDTGQTRKLITEHEGIQQVVTLKPYEMNTFDLEEPVFRQCNNDCEFCFINGLPSQGLRKDLYVRDDDYRLSFLFGNFLSLTNVTQADIKRIGRLRLSPLYISVHTTNPRLRANMFRNSKAQYIVEQLKSLIDENIKLHCQIVVVPGINDDQELMYTLQTLYQFYPGIHSVGVVPVGTTKYLASIPRVSLSKAAKIVSALDSFHSDCRKECGVGFAYCADELFLLAGRHIPPASYYDDFSQLENGIGMLRQFIDEITTLNAKKRVSSKNMIITGMLAKPYVDMLVARLNESCSGTTPCVECRALQNRFFGPTITVSGLLTGHDIKDHIDEYLKRYDRIFLPPNCVNDSGNLLDGTVFSNERVFIAPSSLKEFALCLQS
jgi:putative radical SAM enzyme (TIGR03279 family)